MRPSILALGSLSALVAVVAAAMPPDATTPQTDMGCITMNTERLPLDTRKSPLDSVSFQVGGHAVKICYGRPYMRGRKIFGGLLPYDSLWRTGANEPTMVHTSVGLDIAGIRVPAGTYSLYTVPHPGDWTLIVNRSISQWGEEHGYTDEVKAQEAGRATVKTETLDAPIEQFTIRAEPIGDGGARVLLEWERTRVIIPVSVGPAPTESESPAPAGGSRRG